MKILPYTGVDDGLPRLRDYQEETIQRALVEPTKGLILGDQMGRGKTVTMVEFGLRAGFKRVLFTGIRDTYDEWARTVNEQSDGTVELRRIDATKKGKQALADLLAGDDGWYFSGFQRIVAGDWVYRPASNVDGSPIWKIDKKTGLVATKPSTAIGPQLLPIRESERAHLMIYKKMRKLDAVFFDEVAAVANRKAIGRRTLMTIPTAWRVAASGTWFGNSAEGMWSIARWVFPEHTPNSFYKWRDEFCLMEDVYVAGGKAVARAVGAKQPGRFANSLPLYVQNRAPEQAPPAKLVFVDMTPAQAAQFEDLQRDLVTWALNRENEAEPIVAEIPPVLRIRLRQVALGELSLDEDGEVGFAHNCQSSTLTALRGLLEHYGAQPVLIYTDSRKFADVTVSRMRAAGLSAVAWTGDVTAKERARIKAGFLSGEYQYLVATVQSIGTGVNMLQTVANKLIWLSEAEGNPSMNQQGTARLFRSGMTTANGGFEEVKIMVNGSSDVETMEHILRKANSIAASMRKTAA